MSHVNSAAWPAEIPRVKITGRLLNTMGVAFLAGAFAVMALTSLPVVLRTTVGLAFAAALMAGGQVVSRFGGSRGWWCGTTTMGTGYAVAILFAQASFYVAGVAGVGNPYVCWLVELALAIAACLHASQNRALRFAAVPFTLLTTADVLFHALSSSDSIALLGFTVSVSSLASVLGVLWFAGLSALYQQMELRHQDGKSLEAKAARGLYKITQEAYFVLASINALALPKFIGSMEFAPLWWAIEMPILLAISWRSKSFIKQALVMGVWGLSAVLTLLAKVDLSPLVSMAVPAAGLAMALTYRYVSSSWALWQKKTGYALYLYGSAALALALPGVKLGPWDALPFWLCQSALLMGLALVLSDRVLQIMGTIAAAFALAIFGAYWQQWDLFTWGLVVSGCYGMSNIFGRIKKKGGLPSSEFVPLAAKQTLSAKEARWLEISSALTGYTTYLVGAYFLIGTPYNTIAWGAAAFSLIALGFVTDKIWHRASGLLAMALAAGKLTIFDLSGSGTLMRTLISFGAVGILCIAAGYMYRYEAMRRERKDAEESKDKPDTE